MALVRESLGSSDNGAARYFVVYDDVTGVVDNLFCTTTSRSRGNIKVGGRIKAVSPSRTDESIDISSLGLEMTKVGGNWEPHFNYSFGSGLV